MVAKSGGPDIDNPGLLFCALLQFRTEIPDNSDCVIKPGKISGFFLMQGWNQRYLVLHFSPENDHAGKIGSPVMEAFCS